MPWRHPSWATRALHDAMESENLGYEPQGNPIMETETL